MTLSILSRTPNSVTIGIGSAMRVHAKSDNGVDIIVTIEDDDLPAGELSVLNRTYYEVAPTQVNLCQCALNVFQEAVAWKEEHGDGFPY